MVQENYLGLVFSPWLHPHLQVPGVWIGMHESMNENHSVEQSSKFKRQLFAVDAHRVNLCELMNVGSFKELHDQ